MYNPYCVHTDINLPILREGIEKPSFDSFTHVKIDSKDINTDLLELVDSKDLYVHLLELFYYPPNLIGPSSIHIDDVPGDHGKLNWVYGGKNSLMFWYKSKISKQPVKSLIDTYHIEFSQTEVELVYASPVKTPSIVQAGIPHNITNFGHERWCYSLVLFDNKTNDQTTFDRLCEAFKR